MIVADVALFQSSGSGVTLEHMLSYVPGVLLMEGHVKAIVWSQSQSEASKPIQNK